MAFLGGQMLITLTVLSLFHKFGGKFSFARWLLSDRLVRYLHPTDDQLKEQAGLIPPKGAKQKHQDKHLQSSRFNVPKNLDFPVYACTVTDTELIQLNYYGEYQWLMDFGLGALFVYFLSEFYFYLLPASQEINLGLIWCCLVIAFALKILYTLTAIYFRGGDEAIGERNLCVTFGGFYFLISMIILIVNDNFLEFGLKNAYDTFNHTATEFLMAHNIEHASVGPASQIMFKFWLAIWSGLIGIFFIFPGLRLAQMQKDALLNNQNNPAIVTALHLSFISPLLALLLWIRPIARVVLVERSWNGRSPFMTGEFFDTFRILFIVAVALFRLLMMTTYLQSYLNIALNKVVNLKKESGKIKNIELQRMIVRVYYYLCVVVLQYVGPLLLAMFMCFLLKTLGEHSWSSVYSSPVPLEFDSKPTAEFTWRTLRIIFNPIVFRGFLNYMNWWILFTWWLSSMVGFVYHSYFTT